MAHVAGETNIVPDTLIWCLTTAKINNTSPLSLKTSSEEQEKDNEIKKNTNQRSP